MDIHEVTVGQLENYIDLDSLAEVVFGLVFLDRVFIVL